MLDLSFFKNPRFSAANGAITITFFAMFGSLFLMTQYWQFVHGYTPLEAGVRLLPYAAVMMFVAPQSAKVVERFGTKRVVAFGMTTMAVAMLLLSTIHATTPYVVVISFFCLNSLGMGFVMAPATESVMGSLPRDKAGVGAAMNDTTRQVGGALGVAVIGSIVSATYVKGITSAGARAGLGGKGLSEARDSLGGALGAAQQLGSGAGTFVADAKDAFVHALSYGLRFSALAMLIAAAVAYRFLPARAHDHVDDDARLLADAEAAYEVAQLAVATD
jgi:Na+/melibiose symporter-like transporter